MKLDEMNRGTKFRVPIGSEERILWVLEKTGNQWLSGIDILRYIDALTLKIREHGYGEHLRPKRDEIFQTINDLAKRGILETKPIDHASSDFNPRWRLAK